MSRIFKYMNDNIEYFTGWYKQKQNDDDVVLRLSYNNATYKGALRFNNKLDNPVFQGFNGNEWVTFNSTKGPKGDTGIDFNNTINLVNLNTNNDNEGLLFPDDDLYINEENDAQNNIFIKGITSEKYILNNKEYNSINIKNNNKTISLDTMCKPYNWDFSNLNINELKSTKDDLKFKAYGKVVLYRVAKNNIITKGQIVTLTECDNKICIKPFTYTTSFNKFIDNDLVLGVALEDGLEDQICSVCTEGITTVKCTNNNTDDYINDTNIKLGNIGLLNNDGFIFKSLIKPKSDYIQVGRFLENNNTPSNNYCLFYIKN